MVLQVFVFPIILTQRLIFTNSNWTQLHNFDEFYSFPSFSFISALALSVGLLQDDSKGNFQIKTKHTNSSTLWASIVGGISILPAAIAL